MARKKLSYTCSSLRTGSNSWEDNTPRFFWCTVVRHRKLALLRIRNATLFGFAALHL